MLGDNYKMNSLAIIGMACRFPQAKHYTNFWDNLEASVNSIKEIPSSRWDPNEYYCTDFRKPNKSISKWCGLLENIDKFDSKFFGISARAANNMDPQQRILLEETVRCIEDAGISQTQLRNKKTGVYIGAMAVDYILESTAEGIETDGYSCLGNYECILANRLSHFFGFRGPSFSIDAACSSSLVTIDQARLALQSGEIDYAVTGGVSLNFHPWKYISLSKSRMLSPQGQCKTFDREANGYVPGEGAGVLLLQKLEEALKENNHIHGVILSSSVQHSGGGDSITAPSVQSQQQLIAEVLRKSGVNPETVTYVEAHGTGTSLGDPIEVTALSHAFNQWTDKKHYCCLGSVKSNIGHLEAAAGLAGIIKVLLMMKHRQIVPTLNVSQINPILPIEDSAFRLPFKCEQWQPETIDGQLRAGVNSFGFGGTISHLLLESPPALKPAVTTQRYYPFLLSAKSGESLRKMQKQWWHFCNQWKEGNTSWRDICATLATGRNHYPYRWGCHINGIETLKGRLQEVDFNTIEKDHTGKNNIGQAHVWGLSVTACQWEGIGEIRPFFHKASLLRTRWRKLKRQLNKSTLFAQTDFNFLQSQWPRQWRQVNSFIVNYLYLSSLMDLGFAPRLILSDGSGLWESLALAGLCDPIDIIAVMSGHKTLDDIKVRAPVIAFYDAVHGQVISPYHFSEDYLRTLIDKLDLSNYCWDIYLEEARALQKIQCTFKKLLDEWRPALALWEIDLEKLLFERILDAQQEKLRIIVIQTALIKLYQKWHLSPKREIFDPALRELICLLTSFEVEKKWIVDSVLGDKSSLPHLIEALNEQTDKKLPRADFPLLHQQFSFPRAAGSFSSWFERAQSSFNLPETVRFNTCLHFGRPDNSHSEFNRGGISSIDPSTAPHRVEINSPISLLEAAFALWRLGVEIRWQDFFPQAFFLKIPLPVYEFHGQPHWISSTKKPNTVARNTLSKSKKLNPV